MADLKRKLGEHERLMTWVLLIGIFVDAYFDLGIDWQHWVMALGLQGTFNISRGMAKRGAVRALPGLITLTADETTAAAKKAAEQAAK